MRRPLIGLMVVLIAGLVSTAAQTAPRSSEQVAAPASVPLFEGLRLVVSAVGRPPSHPPTRALARRFAGALPPPPRLRRDLAEALRAKAGRRPRAG